MTLYLLGISAVLGILGGVFFYGYRCGKNSVYRESMEEAIHELKETQKRQAKRDTDSLVDVRDRMRSYTRDK